MQVGLCIYLLDCRWARAESVTVERESSETKRSVPVPSNLKPLFLPNASDSDGTAHAQSMGDYYMSIQAGASIKPRIPSESNPHAVFER